MTLVRKCLVAAGLCAAAAGQTLKVPVSEAKVHGTGILVLNLESPQGKEPAALQWDLAVPPVVAIEPADIALGTAAEAAEKSVNCAVKSGKPSESGPVRYTCILAGGVHSISNGTIASVRYRVREATEGAPIRVGIENILAVFANLRPVALPDVDAVIRVQ